MATIHIFGKGKNLKLRIGSLPMPDKTYRTYREHGAPATALRKIVERWKADCKLMEHALEAANV